MSRTLMLVAALAAAGALAPAGALGQGGSAIDEYQENVPGGGGNKPSNDATGGGGSNALPSSVAQALESFGADGAGALALAAATAPDGAKGAGNGKGSGAGRGSSGPSSGGPASPADDGGSPLSSVIELLGGAGDSESGGMGIALPLILGGTVLAALLALALRRRGGGPGPQGA